MLLCGGRMEKYFNPCSPCGERHIRAVQGPGRPRISIHAPRAGSDFFATRRGRSMNMISIHAPRAGSDAGARQGARVGRISIHAPRAGSDLRQEDPWSAAQNFNPCSPCGERRQNQTKYGLYFGKIAEVSDRQQQRFGMYEVKHERLERLQGHFEKFRGANGRRIF